MSHSTAQDNKGTGSSTLIEPHRVAVVSDGSTYPAAPPYSPSASFPEYAFSTKTLAGNPNSVYPMVREALFHAGLDQNGFGTPEWNPLGALIEPGMTVVLKPNLVRDFRETRSGDGDCLVTHGSVVRAVADYALRALEGKGRLIVADAPNSDADFAAISRIVGLPQLQQFYRVNAGFRLEVYDLRSSAAKKLNGVIIGHERLSGDPAGYQPVDLGRHSLFFGLDSKRLYGSEYETAELQRHQHDEIHEYLISRTVLLADCVIGLPKLKTHKKTGITVNLKNLVGINGDKNWLPHHREGTPRQGGDQFPDDAMMNYLERAAMVVFRRTFPFLGPLRCLLANPLKRLGAAIFGDTNRGKIRSGNWHGNDTTWRMVLDLNRILTWADSEGRWSDQPIRRFFSVVDGVVGGEGNGPLDPSAKESGLIVAGGNPAAVDAVCARLMGFDYRSLPMIREAFADHHFPLAPFQYNAIRCNSNAPEYDRLLTDFQGTPLTFLPHFGWRGHVECA